MRIAILVPNFSGYSGDAVVAKVQAEKLIREGNNVTIFSLKAEMSLENAEVRALGMPSNLLLQRIYRLIYPLDIIKTLILLPQLKNYDLIISHLYPSTWTASLAKFFYGIKYIYWYHGIPDPNIYKKIHEKIYIKLFILFTKWTIFNADQIISVSNFARKELFRYTGLSSSVVYNAPDNYKFRLGLDGSIIRSKYNIGNSPVLLTVGRITPLKGMHYLVDVLEIVKNKISDAKLIIIGEEIDKEYATSLKKKAGDSVIFTGYISHDELPLYYSMCDIYVSGSLSENCNLPIMEAQMCGTTVVAFDIEAHSEMLKGNGILIEPGNTKKFSDACLFELLKKRDTPKKL